MSNFREALVFASYGFAATIVLTVPPIIVANLEQADRMRAYERSFSVTTATTSNRSS